MTISIITVTFNAAKHLPNLIESLQNQTCKNFVWIVQDGGSNDGTINLLNQANNLNIKLVSQEDFGIYDAINKALNRCSTKYYFVLGADDVLKSSGIENLNKNISSDADIYKYNLDFIKNGKIKTQKPARNNAFHSGGALIKRCLHEKYGYYTKKLPIAADAYFFETTKFASVIHVNESIAVFNDIGCSNIDQIGSVTELYRAKILSGSSPRWNLLMLIIVLLKKLIFGSV